MVQGDVDDITGAEQPRVCVAHAALALEPALAQPFVGQCEASAAVVVLTVLDPLGPAVAQDRQRFRHAVGHAGHDLGQVERRVRLVPDAEEEDLAVQLVHPAHGALGDVGRERERVDEDPGGCRARRREGEEVIAAPHAGEPPERVRDDAEVRRRRRRLGVERLVVVPRPRGHDQRPGRTERQHERLDQPSGPAPDRLHSAERRVDEQDAALPDTECAELARELCCGPDGHVPCGCFSRLDPGRAAPPHGRRRPAR